MRVIKNIFELSSIYNLLHEVYKNNTIEVKGTYQDMTTLLDEKVWSLSNIYNVERITAFFNDKFHMILKLSTKDEDSVSTFIFVEKFNTETMVAYGVNFNNELVTVDFNTVGDFSIFKTGDEKKSLHNIEVFLSGVENFIEVEKERYGNLYTHHLNKDANYQVKDLIRYGFDIEDDGSSIFHNTISETVEVSKLKETELPLITYYMDVPYKEFYAMGLDAKFYVVNGVLCKSSEFLKYDKASDRRVMTEGVVFLTSNKPILLAESVEYDNEISTEDKETLGALYPCLVRINELTNKFREVRIDPIRIENFCDNDCIPLINDMTNKFIDGLYNNPMMSNDTLVANYLSGVDRLFTYLMISPMKFTDTKFTLINRFNTELTKFIDSDWSYINIQRVLSNLEGKMPLSSEGVSEILQAVRLKADALYDKGGDLIKKSFGSIGNAIKQIPTLLKRLTKIFSEYKKTQKIRAREKMLNDEIIPILKTVSAILTGSVTLAAGWYFINPFIGALAGIITFVVKYKLNKIEEDTIKRFIVDEMEIIDIKVEQARSKGDDQAVIKLTRLKKELAEKANIISDLRHQRKV